MSFVELLGIDENTDLDPLGLGSRVQSGFGSRGVFGPQFAAAGLSAYDNPQTELRSFYQQMYEGISWGVVQNAPPIVANRIRANRNPVPNTRGRVDVAGGISLQCNTRSMLPFIKHATMSPGNGTRGRDVSAAFGTLNAMTATDMIQVGTTNTWRHTPGSGSELLYSAAAVTALGGADNSFGEENSAPPTQLDITFGNVDSLAADASVFVRATDQNGIVLEERYPINNTAVADPPEYGQVAAGKIRTRFSYVNLTPDNVSVEISGATPTATNMITVAIDAYSAATTATAGQGIIPAMKNTSRNLYEIVNAIDNPLSIYIIKGGNPHETGQEGGIPNVYPGCYINALTLNVSETIMLDMDFIGRNGYTRVTPATLDDYGYSWGRNVIPPDAYTGGTGGTAWDFATPVNPVLTGWESGLQIKEIGQTEWVTVPCTDFNFNLNNQLTHNERYWFRRYHTEPTPSSALDAMVNATVDYQTAQGYDFLQTQNLAVEARMICFSRDVGRKEHYIIAHIGEAVLNETVDPAISGEDVVTQSFVLKCLSQDSAATFASTRTYADTLETMQHRSPIVFEVASDEVLLDLVA